MNASAAGSPRSPSVARVRPRRFLVAGAVSAGIAVAITVWALGGWGAPASGPSTITLSGFATTPGNCSGRVWGCSAVTSGEQPLPSDVNVSVHWIDVSNGQAGLGVWGPSSVRWSPCGNVGTAGECAFVSEGGNYSFGANSSPAQYGQQVNYTLAYPG